MLEKENTEENVKLNEELNEKKEEVKHEEPKKEINIDCLINEKDNEMKIKFLQYFPDKETREKVINSLEHKIAPELYRLVNLAQRMIKEFIKEIYKDIPEEKQENMNIIFNTTNIKYSQFRKEHNMEVDYKKRNIVISEKRKFQQNKVLGYIIHGYAHLFSNIKFGENIDNVLEEGNADVFTDMVINNFINNHPYENIGFHIENPYSIETTYINENSIERTRLYALKKLKIDKKMLMEYFFGDKEKFIKAIAGDNAEENEKPDLSFNMKEFYNKNKFAFEVIDEDSVYYIKNYILPLYKLQNLVASIDILKEGNNTTEIIEKYFNNEKIDKMEPEKLDKIVELIKQVTSLNKKIFSPFDNFLLEELNKLTDMEKKMACAIILENSLVLLKHKNVSIYCEKLITEIIQYLINDLERGIKLNKNNKILDRIEELDDDFGMGNEDAEENIKDLLSYLRAKIEIASNGHITAELFFKRLQATVKNSVKIERNEELAGYQTIREELKGLKI